MAPASFIDDVPRFQRRGEGSVDLSPEARNVLAAILRSLERGSQGEIAAAAGLSETRLSRFKNSDLEGGGLHLPEVAAVLAAAGLQVVPAIAGEKQEVATAELDALRLLARKALESGR